MAGPTHHHDFEFLVSLVGSLEQSNAAATPISGLKTRILNALIALGLGAGTGNVVGPAGATANHLAVFDGATGLLIKDGGVAPAPGIASVSLSSIVASGTYTASGSLLFALAFVIGGGGGGGGVNAGAFYSSSGGGGSGGLSISRLTAAQIGISQIVTIGAGGAGGISSGASGSNGNDSSFGALVIAKGGTGAPMPTGASGVDVNANQRAGGAGGVAGTGDILFPGETGGFGVSSGAVAGLAMGGKGGRSVFGPGGPGGVGSNTTGAGSIANGGDAGLYGGGGGGSCCNNSNSTGGAGKAGIIFLIEFNNA